MKHVNVWKRTKPEVGVVLWKQKAPELDLCSLKPRALKLKTEPCSWKGKALELEQFHFHDSPQPCNALLHSAMCAYSSISGGRQNMCRQLLPRTTLFKTIRWAIELYCRSPVAYQHIRNSEVMALPSTSSVEKLPINILSDYVWYYVIDKSQRLQKLHLPILSKCWCCCWNRTCCAHQESFPCCNAAWMKWRVGMLHDFWAVSLTWKYFFWS